MKTAKIVLLFVLLSFSTVGFSQLTFTVSSNLGFTLTCSNPALLLQATSSYTPTQPTYTFISPANQQYITNTTTVVQPGTWTISAVAGSLSASQTIAIGINTFVPTLTLAPLGMSITCLTPSVLLSGTVSPANAQFSWIEPGVGIGCLSSTCVAYTSGNYGLNIIDPANGCTNSGTITVGDGRIYPFLGASNLFTLACPGGTVDLSLSVTNGNTGLSFQWMSPAGANTSGNNSPVLTTDAPGIYTVVVTNTLSGCSTKTLVNVWACVGISEQNFSNDLHLFPNPGNDFIQLNTESEIPSDIILHVVNDLGEIALPREKFSPHANISIASLPAGIYYLVLEYRSTLVRRAIKFVKE